MEQHKDIRFVSEITSKNLDFLLKNELEKQPFFRPHFSSSFLSPKTLDTTGFRGLKKPKNPTR